MNKKKIYYLNEEKVNKHKIPVNAQLIGTNDAFYKTVDKKIKNIKEYFYAKK